MINTCLTHYIEDIFGGQAGLEYGVKYSDRITLVFAVDFVALFV